MHSSTITLTALLAFIAIGLPVGHSSVLINSAIDNNNAVLQSRNIFQQFVINQIVNVLPQNIRDGINDAAAIFGLVRNDFLIKCLKELQAFQAYSKIDFITAIQKLVKFVDEKLTREQQKELEALELEAIQIGSLMFSNQIKPGQLNKFYDLVVKMVRQQVDGETVVNELPNIVAEILSQHF